MYTAELVKRLKRGETFVIEENDDADLSVQNTLPPPFDGENGRAFHRQKLMQFGGEDVCDMEMREVNVMAVSGKYAMVRRSGCMPYIALVTDLYDR